MVIMTADRIRAYVNEAFLERARRSGKDEVVIVAGTVHRLLKLKRRVPAVCSALDAKKFQEQYRVTLAARSGPRQGSKATWRFTIQR